MSGRYRVEREIGAGGMATVYLARDLRHDRNVALKVLNPELGAVLGVERFLSEIKVTAALQHPNLLPLFDSGELRGNPERSDGSASLFYVMPFVDGETLRHRLERERQLPIDDAIRIAVAVANALDYAHANGVIHRDLKPENILLQHGQPMVADFGIALAISKAGGARITATGLSLGTPQYMSPEQATGERTLDGRTDIYSLAAIVYEMLAGEPPHVGGTAQAIIAKLMTEDVRPLTVLRRSVPAHIDVAVRRALEKVPADRFATPKQFAEALSSPGAASQPTSISAQPFSKRLNKAWPIISWTITGLAIVATAAALGSKRAADTRVERFTIPIKAPLTFEPTRSSLVVTPDGSRIIFSASRDGQMQAYARSLNEEEMVPLRGTENVESLFTSPDNKFLGLRFLDGQISSVPITGGTPTRITKGSGLSSPASSSAGRLIFSLGMGTGLFAAPSTGGDPDTLTRLDRTRGELGHGNPNVLPSGDAVLITIFSATDAELAIATLDGEVTRLNIKGSGPVFIAPDILIFTRQLGDVAAVRFDPKRHRVIGTPVPVLQDVNASPHGRLLAVSADGNLLAYVRGSTRARLALLDSSGTTQALTKTPGLFGSFSVSPDGSRIATEVTAADGTQNIGIYDVKSSSLSLLTADGKSFGPVWSPNGAQIAFSRRESDQINIYVARVDGDEKPRLRVGGPGGRFPGG